MAGYIASGTALVLLSWVVGSIVVSALGLAPAALVDRTARRDVTLRASLWWGLTVAACLTLALGLVVPLRSATAGVVVLLVAALVGVAGVVLIRRRSTWAFRRPARAAIALLAALGLAVLYVAFKALGPATNYDTGLYHLGAIKYAGDFSTIPGLATLYFPFGYNNSQFPLAALLGNGPWDGIGYRLLNGLVLALVIVDLVIRLLGRRYSWGTFVLLVGLGASMIPLVAIADFWLTSPTSDTAVLLLTIVSSAYLADFLGHRRERSLNATVVAVTALIMISMRPTMVFYALAVACVVVVALLRQDAWPRVTVAGWVAIGGAVVVLGGLQIARDRLLSGWLLYPLSLASFDVRWLAVDPVGPREATLAAARDPSAPDHYVVAHSWAWISPWLTQRLTMWETYFLLVGLIATVILWWVAYRRTGFPRHLGRIAACLLPSAVAVLAWFTVSPPSYRFIWGPLFCLVFIPLGAALHALHQRRVRLPSPLHRSTPMVLLAVAIVLLVVTGYSAIARNQASTITEQRAWVLGPVSVPYAVTPIPLPPVIPAPQASGLMLTTPEVGRDQCWDNYPLCTVDPGTDISLRGASIQDGFVRR
jgi:hypothetical protein